MRYISGSEPESLDPQVSSGQPEARLYLGLYDGLTEYHPETAQPIPALAERWEPNADNSEFTFHLRDAKWSNGDPITANDFVYSLRRGLAPEFAARTAYLAYYIKGAQAYNEGKGKAEDVGVDGRRRSDRQVHARAAGAVLPWSGRAPVLPARAAQGHRGARPGLDAAGDTSSRAARSSWRRGSRTTSSSTSAIRSTGMRRTSSSMRSRSTRSKTRRR